MLMKYKNLLKSHQNNGKGAIEKESIFWNSGIFLSKSIDILKSIKDVCKDISDSCETAWINEKVYKNNIYLNENFLVK